MKNLFCFRCPHKPPVPWFIINPAGIVSRKGQLKAKAPGILAKPMKGPGPFEWRFNIAFRAGFVTQIHRQTGVMFRMARPCPPAGGHVLRTVFFNCFVEQ